MEEKKYFMRNIVVMRIFLSLFIVIFVIIFSSVVKEMIEDPTVFYIFTISVGAFLVVIYSYFFKITFLKVPMIEINNEKMVLRTNIFKKEVLIRDINAVFGKKIFTNRVLEIMLHDGKKIIVPLNQVACDTDELVDIIKEFAGLNTNKNT